MIAVVFDETQRLFSTVTSNADILNQLKAANDIEKYRKRGLVIGGLTTGLSTLGGSYLGNRRAKKWLKKFGIDPKSKEGKRFIRHQTAKGGIIGLSAGIPLGLGTATATVGKKLAKSINKAQGLE